MTATTPTERPVPRPKSNGVAITGLARELAGVSFCVFAFTALLGVTVGGTGGSVVINLPPGETVEIGARDLATGEINDQGQLDILIRELTTTSGPPVVGFSDPGALISARADGG